jgi:hypothetical protein
MPITISGDSPNLTSPNISSPTITGAVLSSMASSVITSGTAVASTSGTSIDFTSIPSWVKRVTVMFDSVSTNGTSNYQIQLGDSGGIETTGYQAVSTYGGANGTGTVTTGFPIFNNTATDQKSGALVFTLLNSSNNTWVCQGNVGQFVNQTNYNMTTGGNKSLSATLDRIRITTINGTDTFDNGTINILYE